MNIQDSRHVEKGIQYDSLSPFSSFLHVGGRRQRIDDRLCLTSSGERGVPSSQVFSSSVTGGLREGLRETLPEKIHVPFFLRGVRGARGVRGCSLERSNHVCIPHIPFVVETRAKHCLLFRSFWGRTKVFFDLNPPP